MSRVVSRAVVPQMALCRPMLGGVCTTSGAGAAIRHPHYRSHNRYISTSAPRRKPGAVLTAIGLGLFGATSYLLGSLYPPALIALAFPGPAPPPAAASSPEGQAETARVEALLMNLPQVKEMQAQASPALPESSQQQKKEEQQQTTTAAGGVLENHYVLSRPFSYFPPHMLMHSLSGTVLRKPGLIAAPPVFLVKSKHGAARLGGAAGDGSAFIHLGRSLCGHDGIIHGGLISTVFDEVMAASAFYSLPHHVGVTAHLAIDFRKPVKADQVVVLDIHLEEAKGRKAIVKGVMKNLNGEVLVEGRAVFVEPKFMGWMDTSEASKVMDVRIQ